MLNIKGYQGISLIDYPGKIVSTVFLAGCNFRCPFCHNRDLVEISNNDSDSIELHKLIEIIDRRKGFIEGVCITGGEPLLNDDIITLIDSIKQRLNLSVKIDTNGYNPELLLKIINEKVDFIAMDIKTSFDKYHLAVGLNIDIERIKESIDIIINSNIDYEFRTTVVPKIVEYDDIRQIGTYIVDAKKYVLQQFRNINTYSNEYLSVSPYKPEELEKFKDILKQFIDNIEIRGI